MALNELNEIPQAPDGEPDPILINLEAPSWARQ